MLSGLRRVLFGQSTRRETRGVQAKYDAAQTTDENRRHWASTDDYSANAANSPEVRRTLRKRARYERGSNGYISGLVKTIANDTVGSGPRLQLQLPNGDAEAARRVETSFAAWMRSASVADKLRILAESKLVDGEGFAVLGTNPNLSHAVKLDLKLIEADQVSTPTMLPLRPGAVDGIKFDEFGNATEYHVLKTHPGDTFRVDPFSYYTVAARNVVHWFRPDRPGQSRGIPEFASALPLGAYLRRYTLAVISAAETAAMFAALLKTNLPLDAERSPDERAFDKFAVERGMVTALPDGYDVTQLKAEQPTGTYKEFKAEILNEMGRPLNAPFNVIAGNSSGYNYSSGRLDHQIYHRGLWIERERCRQQVLDKILAMWLEEYFLVPETEGGAPSTLPPVSTWSWDWNWDGFSSIDPVKDATAYEMLIDQGLMTKTAAAAEMGYNWPEINKKRSEEIAEEKRTGTYVPPKQLAQQPNADPQPQPDPANA